MATGYPKFLYDNRLDDGTPAASTTAAGFDVLNLRDWRPYTWWKPSSLPATVTVDCGSAQSADYAALYGHDCATQGNTVEIRGSTDNFSASDVLVATSTPSTDDPLVITFSAVSYRYWRIKLTGGSAPSIAVASIGVALTMPRRLEMGFDPTRREVRGQLNSSEDGHPLGRVIHFEAWEQELAFTQIEWTWLRSTWVPAWKAHLRGTPFLFAWDASDHPTETWLVQSGQAYDTPSVLGSYTELRVKVRGVGL